MHINILTTHLDIKKNIWMCSWSLLKTISKSLNEIHPETRQKKKHIQPPYGKSFIIVLMVVDENLTQFGEIFLSAS